MSDFAVSHSFAQWRIFDSEVNEILFKTNTERRSEANRTHTRVMEMTVRAKSHIISVGLM